MLQQAALHFTLPDSSDPIKKYTDTLYITQVMHPHTIPTFSFIILVWFSIKQMFGIIMTVVQETHSTVLK